MADGMIVYTNDELCNEPGPPVELTDTEKIEYVYQVALKVDAAVREVLPQVGPMLEGIQKNPMLKMFLR